MLHVSLDFFNHIITGINAFSLQKFRDIHKKLVVIIFQFLQRKDVIDHIGRWLLTNPEYLILDDPTRGIDIGTKTEIQKIVLDLADQGMAVTFISSEVEEMLRTCSRMAVLRDGEKVGELEENELSQINIMKAIAGGKDMDTKKIGAFLKQCRKEKNLTQEQLAEVLGVSARTVSRWETGVSQTKRY